MAAEENWIHNETILEEEEQKETHEAEEKAVVCLMAIEE